MRLKLYLRGAGLPPCQLLDRMVTHLKEYKRKHIAGSYSIRLAANGRTLLDYSKNSYNLSWSNDCWWDKHVVVYGDPKLHKEHPVVAFLAKDKHAKSVNIFSDGLEEFEKHYPFLVTSSVREGSKGRYPGEIIPGLLYLGDWDHASDFRSLSDLKINRIVTIHNNPENLKPPSKFTHLKFVLADVETEDVTRFFNDSYTFIEAAKAAKEVVEALLNKASYSRTGVLVHCGAGVSRSAALCIAYLMRKFMWPASKARAHCLQRRSVVMPNDGFWRSLCAFESQLGIQHRSDPTAVSGFSGADAPTKLAEGAAGEKVTVTFTPIHKIRGAEAAQAAARESGPAEAETATDNGTGLRDGKVDEARRGSPKRRRRERSRSRERSGRRERSRSSSRNGRERSSERRHGSGRERRERSPAREGSRKRGRSRERLVETSKKSKTEAQAEERAAEADSPVILESSKEGQVLGRLGIGLKNQHQRCVFGRLPSSEVVLEHLSISRQHAQLSIDAAGDLFIIDLGSAHRTNVDGVWIRPNQTRALPKGSVFKLGGSTREFKVVWTPRERAKEAERLKAAAELQDALAATETGRKGLQRADSRGIVPAVD